MQTDGLTRLGSLENAGRYILILLAMLAARPASAEY